MQNNENSGRSYTGGYMSHDIIADLLGNKPKVITPEEAAEKATQRIIEALRASKINETRKT